MTLPSRPALLALLLALPLTARPDEAADRALVRERHDVLADLVGVGVRNETGFGIGRRDRVSNLTALETSFLTLVGDTWGLAHRIQLPLVWHPEVTARYGGTYGLGDIGYELYAAHPSADGLSFGGGLALVFPTGSDRRLTDGKWELGPALAVGAAWGPVAFSVSARQLLTLGSVRTAPDVNRLVVQPSLTWTLRGGWYLVSAPRLQADWDAASGDRFTIPLGAGAGRIFGIGGQRLSASVEGYATTVPGSGAPRPDWTLRVTLSLLYPR